MPIPQALMDRDVNVHYEEFLEGIKIKIKVPVDTDPYTKRATSWTWSTLYVEVSWSDTVQKELAIDSTGNAILGVQAIGDARAIYEGEANLLNWFTPDSEVLRLKTGIKYSLESVTNPRDKRYILVLRKQK